MTRRELAEQWLRRAIDAVDPRPLTAHALKREDDGETIIAIGKAAAAMCWGAADALGAIRGLCVTGQRTTVPPGIELVVGDHPIPGQASLVAGEKALEVAPHADIALVSGGGSALCESPIDGVPLEYLAMATKALLSGGASIEQLNLVRGHLSRIKGGGLGPLSTYVLSDVSGQPPEVVSSGPTLPAPHAPDTVLELLKRFNVEVPIDVENAIRASRELREAPDRVVVVGDGHTAAAAVIAASGLPGAVQDRWVTGQLTVELDEFVNDSPSGLTVAAGEPVLEVSGVGSGGRNTHAALLAADLIAGTDWVFGALATDGIDGNSTSAGAVVDGSTILRGGDPASALAEFDSATYLERSGDLIVTGPTGTNVADVWLILKI
ncbi:MAG TPA: DUF4147 domain-containing protein [Acidimicrobiia bacterium]|nr:DUF4147 domain-containing protein [Acidimicrobiia bacterium]